MNPQPVSLLAPVQAAPAPAPLLRRNLIARPCGRVGSLLRKCAGLQCLLLVAAAAVDAAAPVEDRGVTVQPRAGQAATRDHIDPRAPRPRVQDAEERAGMAALYYRVQTLEEEIRDLTGLVEELTWRVDRLAKEQRERYIEIDSRLTDLRAPPAPVSAAADEGLAMPASDPAETNTEEDAYRVAFELVTNAQGQGASEQLAGYQLAIERFHVLMADYPGGRYTPNALYWIGELQLALEELELARQAFVQVITLHPEHAKVPDALYKLGVVYHRLGDTGTALTYLDRLTGEFQGSAAASLAEAYAAEIR